MRSKILVSLFLVLAACSPGSGQKSFAGLPRCHPDRLLRLGDHVPDCSFRSFDGTVLKLTSLGKPTVMNFWASWCTSCISEMPAFERVFRELGARVNVVGFNALGVQGEQERSARSFAKARGVTYPTVFDPDGLLYSHFSENTVLPTTIFVSANGTVVFRQFGELDEQALKSRIHNYLKV